VAVEKAFILPGGILEIDRSIFLSAVDMGTVIKAPAYSVLLYDPAQPLLIDSGLNPDGIENPEEAWGERAKLVRPQLAPEDDLRQRLRELELTPEDIKIVLLTHMHWDHTGALRFFKHCPIVVQREELRFAFNPDPFLAAPYMRTHFDHGLDFRVMDGDGFVAPGVSVVKTPGHTPGHQSVIVRTKAGRRFIFSGDAAPLRENLTAKIPLSNAYSAKDCVESLHRLAHLSELLRAEVIPSHDMVVFADLNKSPQAL
jgi:N-acyl homoserine lactone hydrolase